MCKTQKHKLLKIKRGKTFSVHKAGQRYLAHKYSHNNMCGTVDLELYKNEAVHSDKCL